MNAFAAVLTHAVLEQTAHYPLLRLGLQVAVVGRHRGQARQRGAVELRHQQLLAARHAQAVREAETAVRNLRIKSSCRFTKQSPF